MNYEHALVQPEDADNPDAPVLLMLHATGGDERQLLPVGRAIAPGSPLLAPRGQVMENGVTRRFFARRSMTDLDLDDLHARVADLARWLGDALAAEGLAGRPVVAVGYSNGANVAVEMLLQHPGVLAGAVLIRPLLPYEPERPPTLDGVQVLLLAGAHDPFAPGPVTERLAQVLRSGGAEVDVRVRDAGHDLSDADITDAAAWLARCATATAPPG